MLVLCQGARLLLPTELQGGVQSQSMLVWLPPESLSPNVLQHCSLLWLELQMTPEENIYHNQPQKLFAHPLKHEKNHFE